jgi:transposase
MSKRKTYTDEFKTMIAELVLSGKSVKEVSDEYSLSQTAIRNWVKKKTPIDVKGDTTNLEEILKIKKENERLKEENEILKKAMAIFATK